MKHALKRYKPYDFMFAFGLGAFFILQLALILRTQAVFWDEAVFLSMGKYIASGGASGLWEVIRPPLLPLLISLVHVTANTVLVTKIILVTVIGVACAYFYLLLRGTVRPWIAALTALFLLYTPLWFAYTNLVLTDTLSAACIIIACYYCSKEEYVLAGVLSACAFLTRFPTGLVVLGVLSAHLALRKPFRVFVRYALAAAVPVFVWLVANYFAWRTTVSHGYEAVLRPLLLGFSTASTENAGLYVSQHGFYIFYLLSTVPLIVCVLYGVFHWRRHSTLLALALTSLLLLLFFEWLPNDQERFVLVMLPGLFALIAMGLHDISLMRWKYVEHILYGVLVVSITVGVVADARLVSTERSIARDDLAFYGYFAQHPVNGTVLVTSPVTAWYIPNKVVPVYFGQFKQAPDYFSEATAVQVESQDIVCATPVCSAEYARVQERIAQEFTLVYNESRNNNSYMIFVR